MRKFISISIIVIAILVVGFIIFRYMHQQDVLNRIIQRLQAESRAAEVLVTGVNYDEMAKRNFTTIKFLEYDAQGRALEPKYFTFSGNLIQFQSLVVRFDEKFVRGGDRLRGKSVYLFWKAFMLDGANTREFPITKVDEIPGGYKIEGSKDAFEEGFWHDFWKFAFDPEKAQKAGVRSVQIEAPGVVFIPGYLYTIKIEHNGGLRIDTKALPAIVRGEKILQ